MAIGRRPAGAERLIVRWHEKNNATEAYHERKKISSGNHRQSSRRTKIEIVYPPGEADKDGENDHESRRLLRLASGKFPIELMLGVMSYFDMGIGLDVMDAFRMGVGHGVFVIHLVKQPEGAILPRLPL